MALDNLEPFVDVLFHIFVVDQVLLELLGELAGQSLDVVDLFGDLLTDLQDLLIDVSRQEVSTFSRVLGSIFDILRKFCNRLFSAFLDSIEFLHNVLDQALIEIFGFLIGLETCIHLHLDHL